MAEDLQSPAHVVVVPGYTGSGPGHWQTLWQRRFPHWSRVEQKDWYRPVAHEWIDALERHIALIEAPVIVVAHSLGCITFVKWVLAAPVPNVAGALLVAPSDAENPKQPYHSAGFCPVPLTPLPCPSIVVASSNDPVTPAPRTRLFAEAWGSDLAEFPGAGHLNPEDGYGPWPEGEQMLHRFAFTLGLSV